MPVKRYLADTHAVLWFAGKSPRLSTRARRVFSGLNVSTEISVSVVSLWEIALLHDQGRIRLTSGFTPFCDAMLATGFRIEHLEREDIEEARALASLVDPGDRLIAGTALRLGVPLLSADRRVRKTPNLEVVW